VPDWIELKGPRETGHGLAWTFTVCTDKPGQYQTSIRFECDAGVGRCQIALEIKEGRPVPADLILCDSPFDCHTTDESLESLVRILSALPFRFHCLDALTELGELRPRTILLHQSGLLGCKAKDVELLQRLVAAGTNLVVLADEFYRGTTGAANRVLAPFGLQMKQDGSEDPGLSRDQRIQRILDWQARYEQAPFDAGPEHLSLHPLTEGVKRLHWFRPCPVVCQSPACRPLVRNPADPPESFAAVAEPGGYVVAVGKSLWCGMSAVGWPYDNDRFLANILVGGDAELPLPKLAL
jgi:hypothetical protein